MKKTTKSVLLALILLGIFFLKPSASFAASVPDFFSCLNPIQNATTFYPSGIHGIPGDPNKHSGTDSVYLFGSSNAVQCLCENNGQGIQTNWWKVDGITQEEITDQLKNGWNYVADGSVWGLENSPYLAKNEYYICGTLGRGGGEILGIGGGEILGLASTGGKNLSFYLIFGGLMTINIGLYLFRKNEQ